MPGKKKTKPATPPKKGGPRGPAAGLGPSLLAKTFGRSEPPRTAQQSIPYREMHKDGVCRVTGKLYTKTE